ncbi:putative inner membrane transporter YicL [compost metagenome]
MRRLPTWKEAIAIITALLGTFLLVTHGSLDSLSISRPALFWGLISALAMAFYTLNPRRMLAAWGSLIVTGWAMFIGGIGFSFIHPPWKFQGEWSVTALVAVVFIVLFATVIAFYCFLESLNYLSASEASLISCIEPVASAVLAVVWLHVSFGAADWIGTFCIVATVGMLSVGQDKNVSAASRNMD